MLMVCAAATTSHHNSHQQRHGGPQGRQAILTVEYDQTHEVMRARIQEQPGQRNRDSHRYTLTQHPTEAAMSRFSCMLPLRTIFDGPQWLARVYVASKRRKG